MTSECCSQQAQGWGAQVAPLLVAVARDHDTVVASRRLVGCGAGVATQPHDIGGLARCMRHHALAPHYRMEYPRCYPGGVRARHCFGAEVAVAQRRRNNVARFCVTSACLSQQAQRWEGQVAPLLVAVGRARDRMVVSRRLRAYMRLVAVCHNASTGDLVLCTKHCALVLLCRM